MPNSASSGRTDAIRQQPGSYAPNVARRDTHAPGAAPSPNAPRKTKRRSVERRLVGSPLPDSNRRPLPYHGLKHWLRLWARAAFSRRHAGLRRSARFGVPRVSGSRATLVCHGAGRCGRARRRRRAGALRRSGRRGRGGSRSDSDGSAGFVCSLGALGGWTDVCPCRAAESLSLTAAASPSIRQVRVSRGGLDVPPGVEGVRLRTRTARVGRRAASSWGDEDRPPSGSTCWRPVRARSSSAVSRREVWL